MIAWSQDQVYQHLICFELFPLSINTPISSISNKKLFVDVVVYRQFSLCCPLLCLELCSSMWLFAPCSRCSKNELRRENTGRGLVFLVLPKDWDGLEWDAKEETTFSSRSVVELMMFLWWIWSRLDVLTMIAWKEGIYLLFWFGRQSSEIGRDLWLLSQLWDFMLIIIIIMMLLVEEYLLRVVCHCAWGDLNTVGYCNRERKEVLQ